MEPNFFLQEPPAPSPGFAEPEGLPSAASGNAPSPFMTQHAAPVKQAQRPQGNSLPQIHQPPEYLAGDHSHAYADNAQIDALQYAQGQNTGDYFQEGAYVPYAAPHASPVRPPQQGNVQAGLGHISQDFKSPADRVTFESRVKLAERKLKEIDAQLGKVLREKAALEKDLAKEKKDRVHFQELDAKRAQERESVAAWETHWRSQEKQLKTAVEDGRQKNQAMQAKLGALEARLQGAFEEIEKLRGAAGAATERAGQLEKELEEERQAYRELEEEKAADTQMIEEGTAAGKDWSKEAVRLQKELEAERKARCMWQSMTSQLARDLNDEKARRTKELSNTRAEYVRGANGQWLVRIEELEAELKRAGEEAAAGHAADQTKLNEALTELAAEKRQKQSWQQIAERIGKESKEGKREVEVIQKRLQEALKSNKLPVPAVPQAPMQAAGVRRRSSSQRESPAPEGGDLQPLMTDPPGELENVESKPKTKRGVRKEEEDDEETDDEEVFNGGNKRAARVPPRKRLKNLAEVADEPAKKIWRSRRQRRNKQLGDQTEAAKHEEVAGGSSERVEEHRRLEKGVATRGQAQALEA